MAEKIPDRVSPSVVSPVYVEPIRRRSYVYREASDQLHELYSALAEAQGEIGGIPKRHKSHYGMYADLSDIRDSTHKHLARHGLTVHQTLQLVGEDLVLVTTLGHKSGQWLNSVMPIKQAANPQQTASVVTYSRRMALSALLNLATEEEDDGESAAVAASQPSSGSGSLVQRALAAINLSANKFELREKLDKAVACHQEGSLTQKELDSLMAAADRVSKRFGGGADAQ